jgi:signal transduction histidine kinase/CheY-like chemotaxis protein
VTEKSHHPISVAEGGLGRSPSEEALLRKTSELERLLRVLRNLTSSRDVTKVLKGIAEEARELFDCRGVAIFALRDDGRTLAPLVSLYPPHDQALMAAALDLDNCLMGAAIREKRTFVVSDAEKDPRAYHPPGVTVEENQHAIVSPLRVRSGALGALWALRLGTPFDGQDAALANALASCAAAALANARASDQLRHGLAERRSLEAQLLQAQKMEAVGRLAGGVAHDFNNQLTVIQGYTELLLHQLSDEDPTYGPLTEIARAGERARELTNQLLVFSRKQVLRPRPVRLEEVLAGMRGPLSRMLGEDILLKLGPMAEPGRVTLDRMQLEQAIMNLAVNARDAMPQGGELTVSVSSVEITEDITGQHPGVNAGPHAMLCVSDNGAGMSEEVRARIFEPFFTTKEHGKGTGLGLSMVYGFVRQSAGVIEVESAPGGGTTFRLYFPLTSDAAIEERPTPISYMPGGGETILVAEDETMVRHLMVRMLRELGYTVLETANAQEALPAADRHEGRIELLISDMVMPGASGPELVERLRRKRPELRVLYVSGYADHAVMRNGQLTPGSAFLSKPFRPETLARAVRSLLDRGPRI